MHQRGSHLTDFHEVLYLEILRKISLEIPNLVKIGQKFWGLGRLKEFFFVAGDINWPQEHCCGTPSIFVPLTGKCSSTMGTEHTVAFLLQQWLRERPTLFCYRHITHLIILI
jgi:hypothetical protein